MQIQLPPIRPGPLAQSQIEIFFEQGYLIIPGHLRNLDILLLKQAFRRLEDTALSLKQTQMHNGSYFVLSQRRERSGSVQIERVVWCAGAEEVLDRYGRDRTLTQMASQLLGTRLIQQLISQAHFKLPGDGVYFDWHQDSLHRRHGTRLWTDVNGLGSFVEVITAIDPMTTQNGCIQLIPGSHLNGPIPVPENDRTLSPNSFDRGKAIDIELEPGHILAIHPYTIHGSLPNTGTEPRRIFLNGFSVPGANKRTYPGRDAGRFLDVPPYTKPCANRNRPPRDPRRKEQA